MVDKSGSENMHTIARRLNAVKVCVDLMNHEMDFAKNDKTVSIDRHRFDATVTTLEDFIGDIEGALKGTGADGRVLETARATASRVN